MKTTCFIHFFSIRSQIGNMKFLRNFYWICSSMKGIATSLTRKLYLDPSFLVLLSMFYLIAFRFCCLYKPNQMDKEIKTTGEWCPNKHYHMNYCINQQAALYRSSTLPSTHSTFILYPNFAAGLGNLCPGVTGGVLQLDGCLVKYDNVSFVGVEDKAVVFKKCGPSNGYDPDLLNHRDAVLGYLTGVGQYFRAGGSAKVQGVAQCVQDLSVNECQDCLGEATESLKTECASASWGDMFLAKCYVRYSDHAHHLRNDDPNELTDKTLAILIGLITGVILIIILLSGFSRLCDDQKDGK